MPQGGTLTINAENVTLNEHYVAMATEAKAGPYVLMRVTDTGNRNDARNDKVAQLREIGVTSFLTKPFNSNTLLLALHHQFHP